MPPVNPNTVNDQQGTVISVSPTGLPAIPPKAVPWLVGIWGAAYVVAKSLPPHTVAAIIAQNVLEIGALLGLASPGWRKQQ